MRLSFIITIDPVKGISLLNVLLHSLNLQTSKYFNVIFYNQTLLSEQEVFSELSVKPNFDYEFLSIDKKDFFGNYPIWDLFAFHSFLIDENLVHDYFICIHMEEFLDLDYVENALRVLSENNLDILLGNLCKTRMFYEDIEEILSHLTVNAFEQFLKTTGIKSASHWVFRPYYGSRRRKWETFKKNNWKYIDFGFRTQLRPNRRGYTKLKKYEDLYIMKKSFAKKHNWFLKGHDLYFEDIQLCNKKGVCELVPEIQKLTEYPLYFNLSKIYHIQHGKYYYQLENEEFTKLFLQHKTDDIILNTLQEAITRYQSGELTMKEALFYSRRNPAGTGTQNLNYKYHMMYLNGKGGAAA